MIMKDKKTWTGTILRINIKITWTGTRSKININKRGPLVTDVYLYIKRHEVVIDTGRHKTKTILKYCN